VFKLKLAIELCCHNIIFKVSKILLTGNLLFNLIIKGNYLILEPIKLEYSGDLSQPHNHRSQYHHRMKKYYAKEITVTPSNN